MVKLKDNSNKSGSWIKMTQDTLMCSNCFDIIFISKDNYKLITSEYRCPYCMSKNKLEKYAIEDEAVKV